MVNKLAAAAAAERENAKQWEKQNRKSTESTMIILYSQQWQIDNKLHKIDLHSKWLNGKSATAHNADYA